MKFFSGSSNRPLAESITTALHTTLSSIETMIFPDGERRVKLNDTVLEEDTVVIQSTNTPVDQNYIELFFFAGRLRFHVARRVPGRLHLRGAGVAMIRIAMQAAVQHRGHAGGNRAVALPQRDGLFPADDFQGGSAAEVPGKAARQCVVEDGRQAPEVTAHT